MFCQKGFVHLVLNIIYMPRFWLLYRTNGNTSRGPQLVKDQKSTYEWGCTNSKWRARHHQTSFDNCAVKFQDNCLALHQWLHVPAKSLHNDKNLKALCFPAYDLLVTGPVIFVLSAFSVIAITLMNLFYRCEKLVLITFASRFQIYFQKFVNSTVENAAN